MDINETALSFVTADGKQTLIPATASKNIDELFVVAQTADGHMVPVRVTPVTEENSLAFVAVTADGVSVLVQTDVVVSAILCTWGKAYRLYTSPGIFGGVKVDLVLGVDGPSRFGDADFHSFPTPVLYTTSKYQTIINAIWLDKDEYDVFTWYMTLDSTLFKTSNAIFRTTEVTSPNWNLIDTWIWEPIPSDSGETLTLAWSNGDPYTYPDSELIATCSLPTYSGNYGRPWDNLDTTSVYDDIFTRNYVYGPVPTNWDEIISSEFITTTSVNEYTSPPTERAHQWSFNVNAGDDNYALYGPQRTNDYVPHYRWRKVVYAAVLYIDADEGNGALGIQHDGTLWGIGPNASGELGLGDTLPRSSWTQISADTDWLDISIAGGSFTGAYKKTSAAVKYNYDGNELYMAGDNTHGQLGTGDHTDSDTFELVTTFPVGVREAAVVAPGKDAENTFVVLEDGTLWGCGRNEHGELGLGNTSEYTTFTQAEISPYPSPVRVLSVGSGVVTHVILEDNTMWGCGNNTYGMVGTGSASPSDITSFVDISGEEAWSTTEATYEPNIAFIQYYGNKLVCAFFTAITTGGGLYTWGIDVYGSLGQGLQCDPVNIPTKIGTGCTALNIDDPGLRAFMNVPALVTDRYCTYIRMISWRPCADDSVNGWDIAWDFTAFDTPSMREHPDFLSAAGGYVALDIPSFSNSGGSSWNCTGYSNGKYNWTGTTEFASYWHLPVYDANARQHLSVELSGITIGTVLAGGAGNGTGVNYGGRFYESPFSHATACGEFYRSAHTPFITDEHPMKATCSSLGYRTYNDNSTVSWGTVGSTDMRGEIMSNGWYKLGIAGIHASSGGYKGAAVDCTTTWPYKEMKADYNKIWYMKIYVKEWQKSEDIEVPASEEPYEIDATNLLGCANCRRYKELVPNSIDYDFKNDYPYGVISPNVPSTPDDVSVWLVFVWDKQYVTVHRPCGGGPETTYAWYPVNRYNRYVEMSLFDVSSMDTGGTWQLTNCYSGGYCHYYYPYGYFGYESYSGDLKYVTVQQVSASACAGIDLETLWPTAPPELSLPAWKALIAPCRTW